MPILDYRNNSLKLVYSLVMCIPYGLHTSNTSNYKLISTNKYLMEPGIVKRNVDSIGKGVLPFGFLGGDQLHVMSQNVTHLIQLVLIV